MAIMEVWKKIFLLHNLLTGKPAAQRACGATSFFSRPHPVPRGIHSFERFFHSFPTVIHMDCG
jgi:hypothetical protein